MPRGLITPWNPYSGTSSTASAPQMQFFRGQSGVVTPVASNGEVRFVQPAETEIQIGTEVSITPTLAIDRGSWTPAQATPPLGDVIAATFTRQGFHVEFPMSVTNSSATGTPFTHTFTTLVPMTFDTATVTFGPGSSVMDNYGTPVPAPAVDTLVASNSVTFTPWAPVYVDGVPNTDAGKIAGTVRVFQDTLYAYVDAHEVTATIEVPKEPTGVGQLNTLFGGATEASATWIPVDFQSVEFTAHVGSVTHPYWRITLTGSITRAPTPMRVSF